MASTPEPLIRRTVPTAQLPNGLFPLGSVATTATESVPEDTEADAVNSLDVQSRIDALKVHPETT